MKIISSLAFAACLAVANADRKFTRNNNTDLGNSTAKIKTAANFANSAAKIELCPSGDCENGQLITLSMSKLEELGTDDKTVQKVANFASLDGSWSDFVTVEIDGVEAMTTSYVTDITVDNVVEKVKFNLTATIYMANGTALNGNQTIDVPAGALKFSVTIGKWRFKSDENRLQFGVELKARGKDKAEKGAPTKGKKGGNHTNIERVSMGEGMFMDAPTLAVVDGVDTNISSEIVTKNKKTEFVWVFPAFTNEVYYDPVTGSEDVSATPTTDESSPSPTSSAFGWRSVTTGLSLACVAAVSALLM